MLGLNLIEPSKSPYYSYVHLVRKLTSKWRFCIDFSTIKDLSGNIGWPTPKITQTLEKVFGILSDGFRPVHFPGQGIPMETHPDGMEERKSALLTSARRILKRTSIQGMMTFYLTRIEKMLQCLHRLFTRFREYNITLNTEKYRLAKSDINL
jgi:hypothetical protein